MKPNDIITNEVVLEAVNVALKMGLIVAVSKNSNYFHFSDGVRIGYIEFGSYGTFYNMSLEYKPSFSNGSGAVFLKGVSGFLKTNFKNCLKFNPSKITGGTEVYYSNFKQWLHKRWNVENVYIFHEENAYKANDYLLDRGVLDGEV